MLFCFLGDIFDIFLLTSTIRLIMIARIYEIGELKALCYELLGLQSVYRIDVDDH
jgi:hypothetical protein